MIDAARPACQGASVDTRKLALLVAMGYLGELFNNTLESNYDRIRAWWRRSLPGRLAGWLPRGRGGG